MRVLLRISPAQPPPNWKILLVRALPNASISACERPVMSMPPRYVCTSRPCLMNSDVARKALETIPSSWVKPADGGDCGVMNVLDTAADGISDVSTARVPAPGTVPPLNSTLLPPNFCGSNAICGTPPSLFGTTVLGISPLMRSPKVTSGGGSDGTCTGIAGDCGASSNGWLYSDVSLSSVSSRIISSSGGCAAPVRSVFSFVADIESPSLHIVRLQSIFPLTGLQSQTIYPTL